VPKIFVVEETAKTGLATGAAGCSDRRHHKADVEISRNCQRGEAEKKRSNNSRKMEQMNSSRG
jgi:hypothetical protein